MKLIRDEKYMEKLFSQAMFDDKHVIQDAAIRICRMDGKFKAYCVDTHTFLQFPRNLREYDGQNYVADVVEVINDSVATKYYRVFKGSIRKTVDGEVLA